MTEGRAGGDGDGEGEGSGPSFEGEMGGEAVADTKFGGLLLGGRVRRRLVSGLGGVGVGEALSWLAGRCGCGRGKGQVVDGELLDLVEAGAGEVGRVVSPA